MIPHLFIHTELHRVYRLIYVHICLQAYLQAYVQAYIHKYPQEEIIRWLFLIMFLNILFLHLRDPKRKDEISPIVNI